MAHEKGGKGSIAQQMANAPRPGHNGTAGSTMKDALKDVVPTSEQVEDGTLSDQARDAAIASSQEAAPGNPLRKVFTAIMFERSSEKPYVDKKNAAKLTRPAANVFIRTVHGFGLTASISVVEETFDDTETGGKFVKSSPVLYWPTRNRFDRTPSIMAEPDRPEVGMQLNQYSTYILEEFGTWEDEAEKKSGLSEADLASLPRLVKIKRIPPTATK